MSLTTLPARLPWTLPTTTLTPGVATGLSVQIAGVPVIVRPRSLQIVDAIGQRSVASFGVQDYTGVAHYRERMPVSLQDDLGFTLFAGVIASARRTAPAAISSQLDHDITCMDWHYLADKKIFASSYVNVTCGAVVTDIIAQKLAVEGIFAANVQAGAPLAGWVFDFKTGVGGLEDRANTCGIFVCTDPSK